MKVPKSHIFVEQSIDNEEQLVVKCWSFLINFEAVLSSHQSVYCSLTVNGRKKRKGLMFVYNERDLSLHSLKQKKRKPLWAFDNS